MLNAMLSSDPLSAVLVSPSLSGIWNREPRRGPTDTEYCDEQRDVGG